jgi:hypothetical protein
MVKGKSISLTELGTTCGIQEFEAPRIFRKWALQCGSVVSPKIRLPLSTRKDSWYSFLLEAESIPGP